MARPSALTDEALKRLEGKLSDMRERGVGIVDSHIPKKWLASQLGVTQSTVTRYLTLAKQNRLVKEGDKYAHLADIYDKCVDVFSDPAEREVFKLAGSDGGTQQLKALQWVLPRIDPDTWGDVGRGVNAGQEQIGIADIPQEVIDAITDEEMAEVEEAQRQMEAAARATARVIARARARVVQAAAAALDS